MASKKTIERNEKISAEIARLQSVFAAIPENVKKVVSSLIENAAFMTVTLAELQEKMNKSGTVSKYKNGENQYGTKKSPEVEIYNSMIKNHMAIIKELTEHVPVGTFAPPDVPPPAKEPDPFELLAGRGREN
jgi:hypothetical protein